MSMPAQRGTSAIHRERSGCVVGVMSIQTPATRRTHRRSVTVPAGDVALLAGDLPLPGRRLAQPLSLLARAVRVLDVLADPLGHLGVVLVRVRRSLVRLDGALGGLGGAVARGPDARVVVVVHGRRLPAARGPPPLLREPLATASIVSVMPDRFLTHRSRS